LSPWAAAFTLTMPLAFLYLTGLAIAKGFVP
jgi:hypothetical protein